MAHEHDLQLISLCRITAGKAAQGAQGPQRDQEANFESYFFFFPHNLVPLLSKVALGCDKDSGLGFAVSNDWGNSRVLQWNS